MVGRSGCSRTYEVKVRCPCFDLDENEDATDCDAMVAVKYTFEEEQNGYSGAGEWVFHWRGGFQLEDLPERCPKGHVFDSADVAAIESEADEKVCDERWWD